MPLRYCNTCQSTQNSTSWDSDRCLNCRNLFSSMVVATGTERNTSALTLIANRASSDVRNTISEANRVGSSVDYGHTEGNLQSGNYAAEQLQYDSRSGSFNYIKVVFRK